MAVPFLIAGSVFWDIGGGRVDRINALMGETFDETFASSYCSVIEATWVESYEAPGTNQAKDFDNSCYDTYRYSFTKTGSASVLQDDTGLQPRLDADGEQCTTCDGACADLRAAPLSGTVECWVPTIERDLIDAAYDCPVATTNSDCVRVTDPRTRISLREPQFSEWKVRDRCLARTHRRICLRQDFEHAHRLSLTLHALAPNAMLTECGDDCGDLRHRRIRPDDGACVLLRRKST
jgi:hypothetical protein